MQRLQGHKRNGSGTVGVGNDISSAVIFNPMRLISGMIKGISGSCRKAEELSITHNHSVPPEGQILGLRKHRR